MQEFSNLFSPIKIQGLTLKNRIVMAPIGLNWMSVDAFMTPKHEEYYLERARGGAGLLILEATSVNPSRRPANAFVPGIYNDELVPGLKHLVERIHAEGAPIFIQLHDGLVSTQRTPEDLSLEEIEGIRDDFLAAALRAREAGFDGIELHMVHRGTMAEFLSKRANRRTDLYGRSIEGRTRLSVEVLRGIKERLGESYPVSCRILGEEFLLGGNTSVESSRIASILEANGADMIHVSAGGRVSKQEVAVTKTLPDECSYWRAFPTSEWPDALNAYLAEEIKKVVSIPVVAVGKIGTPQVAEEVLKKGKADLIAMGRALVADPYLPKKILEDKWEEVVKCRFCRYCRKLVRSGEPLDCILWEQQDTLN